MAFASGPISFRRYLISGAAPADVTDAFVQAVSAHAFGRYGAATADTTEVGWIGPRHLFDIDFAAEHIAFGRFVHLAMRMDRKAVPSGVLKSYVKMEELAALEASGREYLSREDKQQARDAGRQRAEREMKNGAFRRIAAYPLLIDLDRQTVYFANLGTTANEKMTALFLDTLGCALEPVEAGRLAYRIMEAAKDVRSIEDARPFRLVRAPDSHEGEATGLDAGDRGFLGKEFLTWLWWRIDADESTLRLSTGDEVAVMVDRVMRLECDFGLTGTTAITADGPANLPEAKAALGAGKQPTRMGLVFGGRAGEFSATLDGPKMEVTALALSKDEEQRDQRAAIERRFEQIADAAELIGVLFELFLRRRTASDWPRELGAMRAWAMDVHRRTSSLVASA